jgi:hypothetical protein
MRFISIAILINFYYAIDLYLLTSLFGILTKITVKYGWMQEVLLPKFYSNFLPF